MNDDLVEELNEHKLLSNDIDINSKLEQIIINILIKYYTNLDVKFILNILNEIGIAVNIINDDNNKWAITASGIQSLPGSDEMVFEFFISKKDFFDTIDDALLNYLKGFN